MSKEKLQVMFDLFEKDISLLRYVKTKLVKNKQYDLAADLKIIEKGIISKEVKKLKHPLDLRIYEVAAEWDKPFQRGDITDTFDREETRMYSGQYTSLRLSMMVANGILLKNKRNQYWLASRKE